MGAGMAGRGMGLMRLQALNLTSEQWTRVRQIQQDFQKQIIPKQGEMRVIQIDLQQLLQATQPNMNQVQAKLTAIGNLRTQVQVLRTQEFVQVRGVLTADQLTKFLDPSWTPPCMMPGMQQPMAPMPGRAPGAGHGPMMNR
jgi:Spy/CpxP family protein refolding chaperone